MVKRIHPSNSDFENLSILRAEVAGETSPTDYAGVVVRKPWGYEYLWFQNAEVAVWMLHLAPGCGTSLHCHVRKRTSLIVVSGTAHCSTLEGRSRLRAGDALVLEPCVFHSTRAVSGEGAVVMEVETPPMKDDLVRLRDTFGRVGMGYEGSSQYSTDLDQFEYHPWSRLADPHNHAIYKQVRLQYSALQCAADLKSQLLAESIAIPFLGRVQFGPELIAETGEAVLASRLTAKNCPLEFPTVEILQIARSHPAHE